RFTLEVSDVKEFHDAVNSVWVRFRTRLEFIRVRGGKVMSTFAARRLLLCLVIFGVLSPPTPGQDAPPDKKDPGKLGPLLSQIVDAHERDGEAKAIARAEELGVGRPYGERAGELTVIVEPFDGKTSDSIDRDELAKRGGEITGESESFLRVQAPIRSL